MIKSPLRWFGGKYYLLKHILPFPKHDIYIEVFGGGATVLLNKIPSKYEVYNDINDRLVNFWLILREHCESLKYLCGLKGELESRSLFERYKEQSEDSLEDAFRFFYVNKHSFSGINNTFVGRGDKKDNHQGYLNKITTLEKTAKRIKNIKFENQDFRQLLKRFDDSNVLWYVDPPYFQGGDTYEKGIGGIMWGLKEQEDLLEMLRNTKAKFVLSNDNKEFYYDEKWYYKEIKRINYSSPQINGKKKSVGVEYVITNFDPNKEAVQLEPCQKTLEVW